MNVLFAPDSQETIGFFLAITGKDVRKRHQDEQDSFLMYMISKEETSKSTSSHASKEETVRRSKNHFAYRELLIRSQ